MRPTIPFRAFKAVPKPARLFAAGVGLALLAWPSAAKAPELAMLTGLTKGKWEVRVRGEGARSVCLRSGPEFIYIKHTDTGCNQFVVDDTATDVTVQYTCRGNGYGRTHVRKESAKLVQIESTGIQGGMPFDINAEARHVGPC